MAGRLVGEVMDAASELRSLGVGDRAFWALVVVAERADVDTRTGRVPHTRVMAVLGVSKRTATRAMRELVDLALVERLKRGHRFRRDDGLPGVASIYYLPPLPQSGATQDGPRFPESGATQDGPRFPESRATQDGPRLSESGAIPDQSGAKSSQSGATQDGPVSVEYFRGSDPAPAREDGWRLVACPECGSEPGRYCRADNGTTASTHRARRVAGERAAS